MPFPGSHSLKYVYTVMSRPALTESWYIAMGYLDDKKFICFEDIEGTARYKQHAPWVEQEGPEYWEKEKNTSEFHALFYRRTLRTVLDYYNLSHDGE